MRGSAWWAGIGTPKSTGTKIHSVSGDCERPGLYEYPFGTRVGRILEDCGARGTQGPLTLWERIVYSYIYAAG